MERINEEDFESLHELLERNPIRGAHAPGPVPSTMVEVRFPRNPPRPGYVRLSVIEDGSTVTVATANLRVGLDDVQVQESEVNEDYRGQGLGRRLYEEVFAEAAKRGLAVESDVKRSDDSERLWRKLEELGHAEGHGTGGVRLVAESGYTFRFRESGSWPFWYWRIEEPGSVLDVRGESLEPNAGAMSRATFGSNVEDDEGGSGADRYRIFHDKEPRRVVELNPKHRFPRRVGLAGRALSVSYRTDKWKEDGDDIDYKHVFDEGVEVFEPWGAQDWLEEAELPRDYPSGPLTLLGQCLGMFLTRADDDEVYESHMPASRDTWLLCAPDGRMLFVYDPAVGFRAIIAGGDLSVEEEGIDH